MKSVLISFSLVNARVYEKILQWETLVVEYFKK